MRRLYISLCSCLLLAACSAVAEDNRDLAPLYSTTDGSFAGHPPKTSVLGPLFESREMPDYEVTALRPFYLKMEDTNREKRVYRFLYPLFNFYRYDFGYSWNAVSIIRGSSIQEAGDERRGRLEFWPFYLSHQVPEEGQSYRGVMPFYGGLENRLGFEKLDWLLFPLYFQLQNKEKNSRFFLYPIFEYSTGENDLTGWRVWPLYGVEQEPGISDKRFFLWPFFYSYTTRMDEAVPYRRWGALPLITGESAEGMESRTFLWPFMGYTFEDDPRPQYDEYRLFWPFWVQARGEEASINRWLPLFSYETREANNFKKRWFFWPLYKQTFADSQGLRKSHHEVLFFLYQSDFYSTPDGRKSAGKRHLLPLFSYWQDGNGREQIQALDPFSIFFPNDVALRESLLPLFAIYRMDRRPGLSQHSFLWDTVFYEESNEKDTMQVGPLFESVRGEKEKKWELLKGLIGYERKDDEKRYKFLWISF